MTLIVFPRLCPTCGRPLFVKDELCSQCNHMRRELKRMIEQGIPLAKGRGTKHD